MHSRGKGALIRQLLQLLGLIPATLAAPLRIRASVGAAGAHISPAIAASSTKYLIASFPNLNQVAYVHLPDNVWRPLVIGEVGRPEAVAVDAQNARLFISDPPNSVVWWYKLGVQANGLLATVGPRHAAIENYIASWLAVNNVGDLYFTGRQVSASSLTPYDSIFKQEAGSLATGDSLNPRELFSRSNTGSPDARAWTPSGLAVDSFYVYWGNAQNGSSHGAVVKGSHSSGVLRPMHDGVEEVRGVTVTGTHTFFLSPEGVFGVSKNTPTTVHDATQGLVAPAPLDWNPVDIAWDGENTLYLSDSTAGALFSLPAQNVMNHNLTRFVDSPSVHGLAIIGFRSSMATRHLLGLAPLLVAAVVGVDRWTSGG